MSAQATVLYDAPGPKARTRSRIISVVGLLALAGLIAWVIYRLSIPQVSANGAETSPILDPVRWEPLADARVWEQIARGVGATLAAAAVAMVGALILAVVFAFGRLATSPLIRVPVAIVLEFFRGMPVLLMMLFILLVASTGAFWAVVIALVVYNGAILGEALRAGMISLGKGQREAGLSIGLTPTRTRLLIELPQAFTQMLPIIMAQLVVLLKDTSLGYIVGYYELLRTVTNLSTFFGNQYQFTFWFVGAVVYLALNIVVSLIGRRAARIVEAKRA
ncbi:amino acid ABC transporter permease [Leucobacter luti]|uniref:Amino acid ABC transporter membrane protein 2 (PAAT family) n=1 Tax=Leucobacter luti TaxID=340320 RepID=A0A4R6S9E7_9MICO|nr:ABC transporter permease subunit [Leucobacter luti]MCW2288819.1 glutamate transport system permease protein [Leucobacter luti]QYM75279.1 ABC transporter permease subunit [Leucobacter luti]TCK45030.1 amino acid ABC transporter membrane protein 2 (PAAT family) [Leucobacter luti]TDP95556.1 amino acid ABC transporter membrane protein 2 (PAAT family) [Leucobacter luti]